MARATGSDHCGALTVKEKQYRWIITRYGAGSSPPVTWEALVEERRERNRKRAASAPGATVAARRKESEMTDAIVVLGVVIGLSVQIQAVWDLSRAPLEGEDTDAVQAQAILLAVAGGLFAVVALAVALFVPTGS